ncbi:MAG: efflux RND transporter periplasmic adaptor subunit [Alphaproteobacteria bacterium]
MFSARIVVLCLLFVQAAWAQERPSMVGIDDVRLSPITRDVSLIGKVVANQSGPISSNISGRVQTVLVRAGDVVKIDDPMVIIDPEGLQLNVELAQGRLREATASLQVAEAELRQAERGLSRAKQLRNSASFSSARLEDAEDAIVRARALQTRAAAAKNQAETQLSLAEKALREGVIRAPFNGVVFGVMAIPGAYVTTGSPVVSMVNVGSLELEIPLPSQYLSQVTIGSQVVLEAMGETRVLSVSRIIPREDPRTRARPIRIELPLSDDFVEGKSLEVSVRLRGKERQLTMSKDALIDGPRGKMVFKMVDGAAIAQPVVLGESVGNRFIVKSGLQDGDKIVIRGNERLRPGQAIKAMPKGRSQS